MSGGATADGLGYLLDLFSNGEQALDLYYLALVVNEAPGFTIEGSELDEPTAPEYTRTLIANDSGSWEVTETSLSNSIEIVFPLALLDWGAINYWALCDQDQDNGGRVLFVGQLDDPLFVEAGQQVVFPPGSVGIDMSGTEWLMGQI
jgi:hypothetical protein